MALIGGKFGLEGTLAFTRSVLPVFKGKTICMVSARCCMMSLAECLRPQRIWMPSYLCPVMLDPFKACAGEVIFYGVDDDLALRDLHWLDEVTQGDLVVFIDYFGFPCPREYLRQAADQGAWVLEDASQAMLTDTVGQNSDFLLYSPRKFAGVPDGGILTYDEEVGLDRIPLQAPPVEWWLRALEATLRRREFDLYGQDRQWFPRLQAAEAGFPLGHYAMSELAHRLFFHGFDYAAIAQRRAENYAVLLAHLRLLSLLGDLPAGVVPLGFPIRLANRATVQRALFEKKIYPPVHWGLADVVPKAFAKSYELSAEILTLPCDQRYTAPDMERMAQAVLEVLDL